MAVNGTGSLVVLVIVLLGALAFQAQVEGKPQDKFHQDKEYNVSRIFDHTKGEDAEPEKASPYQFPWQVLVIATDQEGDISCGGSIIDQEWIMSAAHCFSKKKKDKDENPNGYEIIVTSVKLYVGILLKNLDVRSPDYSFDPADFEGNDKHVFIHEDYNKGVDGNNDIALLKLKVPLSLTNKVYPILLATLQDVDLKRFVEHPLIASGWGLMSFAENAETPNDLRYVTGLHLMEQDDCAKTRTNFDKATMICHETTLKKTGGGDSGGPVIFKNNIRDNDTYVQIGIVKRGSITPGIYSGTFMNVAHFRPWIHKTMSYIPDDKSIIEYPNGFFRSSGLWYRLFKGEQVSWDKARSKCRSFGMRLAEPRDDTAAEALQKDTLAKFDVFSAAWIGAQGDGVHFRYKVSGHIVPRDSPLLDYLSISLYDPTDGNCLVLNGENTEDPPYGFDRKVSLNYPLCEDSPDTSIIDASSVDLCEKKKGGHCIEDGGKCENTIENLVNSDDDACVCCLPGHKKWQGTSGHKENMAGHKKIKKDLSPGHKMFEKILQACAGSTRCHIPTSCPDDEDFFTLTGTKQCFKILKQSATWEKANEDCKELNLTLAQPFAPVQLRSYIVQEYGLEEHFWLGACQDEPNKMTWKKSGEEITIEDPLWYPGQPDFDEGCLLLLSSEEYLEEEPEKPFWNVLSTYEFYPLCEYLPDSIDNGDCGSNSRVFLTRTGSKQCVPTSCPEDDDFFMPTGSKQCFKILKEKATWEQAVEECDEQGLDLAHPFDSVQLRSYIVQRYGRIEFLWLGASRNGETGMMIWERFGEEIPLKNPLWYKKHPKDGRLGCLLLLSNGRYWKKSADSPYWDSPCDIPQYPLCELVLP